MPGLRRHIHMLRVKKWLNILMTRYLNLLKVRFAGKKVFFLAPVVKGRKGHYKELFEQLRRKGFLNVRINNEIRELTPE